MSVDLVISCVDLKVLHIGAPQRDMLGQMKPLSNTSCGYTRADEAIIQHVLWL